MIKSIGMVNVKGQTAVQELTGKDIIIGRNGAGKTTRMQSIGLAMLGYVPGKGKTAADTFKLASDDEMGVRMETDNLYFERIFTKSRKLNKDGIMEAKISQKLTVSPSCGEKTNTQKEQRIQQELGDFPVMLDFGAFINMTDNQQRDFIYSLGGNGQSWDRARVEIELTSKLLKAELEETNKDLYDCMKENIVATMKQYSKSADVQAGILAMSEYAKEQLAYWKKEKVNADGAAKKLTELKNRGAETDRDLNINMEKMKELQEKRDQVVKELAEHTARNKVLSDKALELQKLQEEIAKLAEAPDTERMAFLEAEIAIAESTIESLNADDNGFTEMENQQQNKLASLQEALRAKNEELLGLKEQLATINAEIKANGDLLQRIADHHGCCAFSPNIPCNQDFSAFINETNDAMDTAYDKKDDLEHAIDEAEAKADGYKKAIEETKILERQLNARKQEHNKNKTDAQRLLERNKTELLEIRGREPVLNAKQQQAAEIAAYLEANPQLDLTAMEDNKTLLAGQIEGLSAKIDEQKKIRNDLLNIKANMIDSQTADFNVLCWNQISQAIGQKGIKGEIVKETLNPLMEDVDLKLHALGIDEQFFFETNSDTGKEIFEFGWGNRPFSALSTGEQLLLLTALMTTMIERANPPVKVLALDNINDLDKQNLSLVIKGLNTIGTKMDNIILAGVAEPTEEDSEGWTIWRL